VGAEGTVNAQPQRTEDTEKPMMMMMMINRICSWTVTDAPHRVLSAKLMARDLKSGSRFSMSGPTISQPLIGDLPGDSRPHNIASVTT
jgi:hypothetical protein